jgi:hypothetical protein
MQAYIDQMAAVAMMLTPRFARGGQERPLEFHRELRRIRLDVWSWRSPARSSFRRRRETFRDWITDLGPYYSDTHMVPRRPAVTD